MLPVNGGSAIQQSAIQQLALHDTLSFEQLGVLVYYFTAVVIAVQPVESPYQV